MKPTKPTDLATARVFKLAAELAKAMRENQILEFETGEIRVALKAKPEAK